MKRIGIIMLSMLIACGGDDDGDDGTHPIDAPAATGPSTDPSSPTPLALGTTVAATYAGSEHFFVVTAAAGVYTATFTGPTFAQVNHCDETGGCLCALGAGGNCCMILDGETSCTYQPDTASGTFYPVVYMRPGVTGDYTLRID